MFLASALALLDDTTNNTSSTIALIIELVLVVLIIAGMWATFSKAGKPGWAAIIPIYNTLVLLQVAGRPWWWILLLLIPIVNIVLLFIVYYDVSKSFGHGAGFMLGLVFLPFIFWPILGFGGSRYMGPAARR